MAPQMGGVAMAAAKHQSLRLNRNCQHSLAASSIRPMLVGLNGEVQRMPSDCRQSLSDRTADGGRTTAFQFLSLTNECLGAEEWE